MEGDQTVDHKLREEMQRTVTPKTQLMVEYRNKSISSNLLFNDVSLVFDSVFCCERLMALATFL